MRIDTIEVTQHRLFKKQLDVTLEFVPNWIERKIFGEKKVQRRYALHNTEWYCKEPFEMVTDKDLRQLLDLEYYFFFTGKKPEDFI